MWVNVKKYKTWKVPAGVRPCCRSDGHSEDLRKGVRDKMGYENAIKSKYAWKVESVGFMGVGWSKIGGLPIILLVVLNITKLFPKKVITSVNRGGNL